MRCGLWLATVVMVLAVTSAVRMREVLSAFVEDLARLQRWRAVVLVYCAGRSMHPRFDKYTLPIGSSVPCTYNRRNTLKKATYALYA